MNVGTNVLIPLQDVKELGSEARNSHKSVLAALKYLAIVVVQDAVVDAERLSANSVHRLLMEQDTFRYADLQCCASSC